MAKAALAAEQQATHSLQGSLAEQQAAAEALRQAHAEDSGRLQADLHAATAKFHAEQESHTQVSQQTQSRQAACQWLLCNASCPLITILSVKANQSLLMMNDREQLEPVAASIQCCMPRPGASLSSAPDVAARPG